MGVEVEFSRDTYAELYAVARDLHKLGVGLRSYKRLLGLMRDEIIIPFIHTQFRLGNIKWTPITDYAAATRKVNKDGRQYPLIDTGKLRRRAMEKRRFYISGRDGFMEYGNWTDTPWGRDHNLGGLSSKDKPLPERPFTQLDNRALQRIDRLFLEWVQGTVRQHVGETKWRRSGKKPCYFSHVYWMVREYIYFFRYTRGDSRIC